MKNIILLISLILFSYLVFDAHQDEQTKRTVSFSKESRKRIVVIDTGIGREHFDKPFICQDLPVFAMNSKKTTLDTHGHGTNVVGLIVENLNTQEYCITVISVTANIENDKYTLALRLVRTLPNVVALNLSISNPGSSSSDANLDLEERERLKIISDLNIKIIVASGNNGSKISEGCSIYPACHKPYIKNMTVVGNINSNSNFGPLVDYVIDGNNKGKPVMSGSSQSTAIYTGLMFKK